MRPGTRVLGIVLAAGLVAAACGPGGDDPGSTDRSAGLFDPAVVHDVTMEIDDDDLARLEPPTEQRVPVRLAVDGETIEQAGVRLKRGSAQYQGLDAKPGFSLETDEFVDDVDLYGVTRFTLGNAALDASFVAEHLAYEVFRAAGVPVAHTALARVTVNGETFGLYVMRETYDEAWLERTFDHPEGNLYEAPDDADVLDTDLELRTNERQADTSDLDAVAEVVASAPDHEYRDRIEGLVDVDGLLTYWAVEAVVGHWDGYVYDITAPGRVPPPARPPGNPGINNFYAYHDPGTDRFVIVPHGADLAFGLGGRSWRFDPATPVLTPPKAAATVAARLWELPGFPDELAGRVDAVLDDAWDPARLVTRAEMLAELVRADGLTGTREQVTLADFEVALAERVAFIGERGPAVQVELGAWSPTSTAAPPASGG